MKTACLIWTAALCILLLPAERLWAQTSPQTRIGVALPTAQQQRWVRDAEYMQALGERKSIEVLVEVANNNQMQQNLQINRLLSQKIQVLILAPHDALGAAAMVKKAHDQGVKVISYDRLVLDSNVDLYITFDNEKVGELQALYLTEKAPRGNYIVLSGSPTDNNSRFLKAGAMRVLTPLVEAGMINIVADEPIIDWDPNNARKIVEKILGEGIRPAAIVAPNDDTAGGVIAALKAYNLDGKIPVGGQDADVMAARRIMGGQQSMTVFKDTRLLGETAVNAAIKMARKQPIDDEINASIPNGSNEVPAILLTPEMVDKANLQTMLIDSQYMTREEVFGNQNGDL